MAVLLDSGCLYALLNRREHQHAAVVAAIQGLREPILLPTLAVTEVAYLLLRDVGPRAVADLAEQLATGALRPTEPLPGDYARAAALVRQYEDAPLDLVDAILVAMAERLEIRRVLTLDQRHFRLVQPQHVAAFEILP